MKNPNSGASLIARHMNELEFKIILFLKFLFPSRSDQKRRLTVFFYIDVLITESKDPEKVVIKCLYYDLATREHKLSLRLTSFQKTRSKT